MATETSPREDYDDQSENLPMRVGLGQFTIPTPERLRYIKQLGVEDAQVNMYGYDPSDPHFADSEHFPLTGEREWTVENLTELREQFEDEGLRLNAVENVPVRFYDQVMLGGEKADEQLEHMKTTIRNLGRAGIPMFGYHWMPGGVVRTTPKTIRGGAEVTAFDAAEVEDDLTHDREYTEAELWDNYERFLDALLPVAEEAGVTMCLHPNDPPVAELGGVPQLFRNFENFRRAMELVPSSNHALELCLGCWSEMGEDVVEVIRHFGERDQLGYVHFRDVEGTVPKFRETFVDEGNFDTYDVLETLHDVGFSGMLLTDHVPHMEGDSEWGHRGRAHAVGFLNGMLEAIDRQAE
nr:mannonate dehydratase [Halovivax sp. KZCA124]